MYRRSLLLVAVAATAAPPLAPAWAEDGAIMIDNFTFSPAVLTVPVGAKVVWTNRDDMPHSVVSADAPPVFKSHPLDTDDVFAMVFDKPGTYRYFCGLHPHMGGTVVVK
ncbi:MAG TPA: cupredoxin family copper-binding protein [Acetobacteraceae bacterium]|jgi:plastocyanin